MTEAKSKKNAVVKPGEKRSMNDDDSSGNPTAAEVKRKWKVRNISEILAKEICDELEKEKRNAVVANTGEKVSVDDCLKKPAAADVAVAATTAVDTAKVKREEIGHSLAIRYQCNDCKKLLKSKRTLRKHMIRCKEKGCVCKVCGKAYSKFDSLARHKLYHCNASELSTLNLKWNGESWKVDDERLFYRIKLGRDLANLIGTGTIKVDVLNATQVDLVMMYRKLFNE